MSKLFCFGLGYSASVFASKLVERDWQVCGTTRNLEKMDPLSALGFTPIVYDGLGPVDEIATALGDATHLLISIAPGKDGDPVLRDFGELIREAKQLRWVGYLSTVGVYGDCQGEWIDESAAPRPVSDRSKWRVIAEDAWLELGRDAGLPVHLFRISGIYGPGRSPIENLKKGTARRIVKEGQVFNRIHVEDIARILIASADKPNPGGIYNTSDNEPAPPQDVVTYAAEVLGVEPPPLIAFEDSDLTAMGRSFYGECKRVSNARIREELGVELAYPSYREGVQALAKPFLTSK